MVGVGNEVTAIGETDMATFEEWIRFFQESTRFTPMTFLKVSSIAPFKSLAAADSSGGGSCQGSSSQFSYGFGAVERQTGRTAQEAMRNLPI